MALTIHHPHDKFVKACLLHIAVVKDLLKPHLLPDIVERINWDAFQVTNKSFVDEKLQQTHSDMVYQCQLDNQDTYLPTSTPC